MQTDLPQGQPLATDRTDSASLAIPTPRRRKGLVLTAVTIIIVLAIAAAMALTRGDDTAPEGTAGETLELSLGEGDALASCLPVDATILADMAPAFAATATTVEGETITLTVDRWYAGGDADTVILHAPAGLEALIAGFDFEVGQRYLVTATEGTVNYCGFSGPATPELQAVFDAAFPS